MPLGNPRYFLLCVFYGLSESTAETATSAVTSLSTLPLLIALLATLALRTLLTEDADQLLRL